MNDFELPGGHVHLELSERGPQRSSRTRRRRVLRTGCALAAATGVIALVLVGGGRGHVNVLTQADAPTNSALTQVPGPSPSPASAPTAESSPAGSSEDSPGIGPSPSAGTQSPSMSTPVMTQFRFYNHDPEGYEAMFYVGDEAYGPFASWTQSELFTHVTMPGLVVRLVFPQRHECDEAFRGLETPIHGTLTYGAQRTWKTSGCSRLQGMLGDGVPDEAPWTLDPSSPPSPADSAPGEPGSPSPTPAGTRTPAPTQSAG